MVFRGEKQAEKGCVTRRFLWRKGKKARIKKGDFRHKNRGDKSEFLSVDGGIKRGKKYGFTWVFRLFSRRFQTII